MLVSEKERLTSVSPTWKKLVPGTATDWPADKPFNFGSPAFVKKHPLVAKLIWNMKLTNREQARMIYQVEVKKRKIDEVVWEWLSNNYGPEPEQVEQPGPHGHGRS